MVVPGVTAGSTLFLLLFSLMLFRHKDFRNARSFGGNSLVPGICDIGWVTILVTRACRHTHTLIFTRRIPLVQACLRAKGVLMQEPGDRK